MRGPQRPELTQGLLRQRHVALLAAFAVDAQEHALGVQVSNLQAAAFVETQTAGIDGRQADAVDGRAHTTENLLHFLPTQDHGQFFGLGRAQQFEDGPVSLEGVLEEEFDGAQGDGGGGTSDFLFQGEVKEVPAQLFLGDEVGD